MRSQLQWRTEPHCAILSHGPWPRKIRCPDIRCPDIRCPDIRCPDARRARRARNLVGFDSVLVPEDDPGLAPRPSSRRRRCVLRPRFPCSVRVCHRLCFPLPLRSLQTTCLFVGGPQTLEFLAKFRIWSADRRVQPGELSGIRDTRRAREEKRVGVPTGTWRPTLLIGE